MFNYIKKKMNGIAISEAQFEEIEFLLDNNFTIYFIPEGISSYDGVILHNFDYELVYEMERSWFERC